MDRISPRRLGLTAIVAALALDQLSKHWVLNILRLQDRPDGHIELSPIFDLSFHWNTGVSFGMLKAGSDLARWGLFALSLSIASLFTYWLWQAERRITGLAMGLVVGGALGNMIDRARWGAVADFLDFRGLYFPWIFNVADSAITLGAALMFLDIFLVSKADKTPPNPSSPVA